jgi:GDP-L-fucose synthase
LVTGGTGLIGRPLVELLNSLGSRVRIASLDDPSRAHPDADYRRVDLMDFKNCLEVCDGVDYVFHLAGIKGSPAVVLKKAATIFVSFLRFNTNMMEAARQCGVKRYLFTSTIGVYAPAEVFYEDDLWKNPPSQNDWFGGWAKRMGELQAQAYKAEYGWDKVAIVRPANVYGPYDNFDTDNAMVIPSLVRRAVDGEDPFVVWGDGTPVRDFIHSRDVARGMLLCMEKGLGQSVNLGSGTGVSIRRIVDIIIGNLKDKPKLVWDTSKPSGDKKRLMDISRARTIGFSPEVSIEEGIKEVMDWYGNNKALADKRFNPLRKSP